MTIKKKQRIPLSILKTTQGTFDVARSKNIIDHLRHDPSIHIMQSGTNGSVSSIYLRGHNADHTSVYIDGLKANNPSDPTGRFDPKDTLLSDKMKVKVVKGPQSAAYGSGAMGGIIHIETPKGSGTPKIDVSNMIGSHRTDQQDIQLDGNLDRFAYHWDVQRLYTGGTVKKAQEYRRYPRESKRDPYHNQNLNMRTDFDISEETSITIFNRLTHAQDKYSSYSLGCVGQTKSENHSARLQTQVHPIWKQSFQAGITSHKRRDGSFTIDEAPYDNKGKTRQFTWQNHITPHQQYQLSTRYDHLQESYQQENSYDRQGHIRRTQGLGFGHLFVFFDDHLQLKINHRLDCGGKSKSNLSHLFGGSYLFSKTQTTLFGHYATSFKIPSLDSLYSNYGPMYKGNPTLKPEKSKGWEAGINQKIGDKLSLTSSYFENHIRQLIVYSKNWLSQQNIDRAKIKGHEHQMNYIHGPFSFSAGITFVKAVDKVAGLVPLYKPTSKSSMTISYVAWDKHTFYLTFNRIGKRPSNHPTQKQLVILRPVSLLGMGTKHHINDVLEGFTRIDNTFNKKYEEPKGYQQMDLSIYVGIKFKIIGQSSLKK